jgi:hypothetical protein
MSEWLGSFDGPGERQWRRLCDNLEFDLLQDKLRAAYTPAILYRAMLFWVRRSGKKDGLAYYCFLDMFGGKVKERDRGEPIHLDDRDFERWMELRFLRARKQWQREKARRRI